MADITSEFLRHEPCDICGSSDALSVYSDGHTYCFSCHTYTPGGDEPIQRMNHNIQVTGEPVRLTKRKIPADICKQYKIYRDDDKLRFYYCDEQGRVVGCKTKTKDKEFKYEGKVPGTFFGQHLFKSSGQRLVITEGELDAASVMVAMPTWQHVSLPTGAAGAKKAIQKQLSWLQGWDEIVLFFDNDEPGRKAAEEAASVLPPGKAYIANLDHQYKDASDALMQSANEAIRRAIWDASVYRPDGIVEAKNLLSIITTPNPPNNHDYPFSGLQTLLHGIRYGELITITAGSGVGKSSFCRELAASLLQDGERVGYLALEESNRRTALGLMSVAAGKPLHIGEYEADELESIYKDTIAGWNLFLFDGFGSYDF